ncbi:MAG: MlaE family ABC transporter permease [Burkholderiaceae bacterium]|jgi:phospholipid/cholesterol/gamma-HCH transport system permease protein
MATGAHPSLLEWNHDHSATTLRIRGRWTVDNYALLRGAITHYTLQHPATGDNATVPLIDASGLERLDTAGAQCLYLLLGNALDHYLDNTPGAFSAERIALLRTVGAARPALAATVGTTGRPFHELLGRIGASSVAIATKTVGLLGFIGITLAALARNIIRPGQWRVTSVVAQLEQCAFNAVPIIALLTFMVGAVVAFLGATILDDFGASIYTVNLVAFSFLREFAVLLTAILVAGRTASAFTAQIGSMKANEEIDAIRMLGLNPVDILVLPRVIALVLAVPMLTFIGMVAGMLGGAVVCAVSLDISPTMFMSMIHDKIPLKHFWVGMAKAPVFAFIIAVIGCMEGFQVKGSAESVGQHTTSAVVQSIFIVILIDAFAALFFMEMGW